MSKSGIHLVLVMSLFFAQASLALKMSAEIRTSGQAVILSCEEGDSTCTQVCGFADRCEIPESYCDSCGGTQNLKLLRILDSVGTALTSKGEAKPVIDLLQSISHGTVITLHPKTLYNYSSAYDGSQMQAKFRALCTNLSPTSNQYGILLVSVDAETHSIQHVVGAVCPDEKSGDTYLYSVNKTW